MVAVENYNSEAASFDSETFDFENFHSEFGVSANITSGRSFSVDDGFAKKSPSGAVVFDFSENL